MCGPFSEDGLNELYVCDRKEGGSVLEAVRGSLKMCVSRTVYVRLYLGASDQQQMSSN